MVDPVLSTPKTACHIIDGRELAELLRAQIQARVSEIQKSLNRSPGLGVILVGENAGSQSYVAMKERFAKSCGMATFDARLNSEIKAEELKNVIKDFNQNPLIDGILLQLPLPKHLDSEAMIDLILPEKDADGLHPFNQGLVMRGKGVLQPCTPRGSLRLLDLALARISAKQINQYSDIPEYDLSGKTAIVIGRSILVGKPLALMLQQRNATVIMAHSKTKDLAKLCSSVDFVFAAAGSPNLVKSDWVHEKSIVIDVGTSRLENGKLTGDVDFKHVSNLVAAITPVPGGVGPMTVAMLILNTLTACERRCLK
jgi:methylenetetrahydrofolate dehydrogenase (NADP+) / methenyltetrahydrofolate cyclohydrolase